VPQKYWVTKPFFITANEDYVKERIENLMQLINDDPDAGEKKQFQDDVADWRLNPFQPHNIAEYRTVAYQKTVVMKFVNHLIAWGDNLFRQDTMETVNQATQLYVLANEILGPQPQIVPPAFDPPVDNYYQLEQKLDVFSNALVDIETLLPMQTMVDPGTLKPIPLPSLETLYFCIPVNSMMMDCWTLVANRLYNIRHCLNLDGIYAPPSLFAPKIDPGQLVRAWASGQNIGNILNDLNTPLPYYRFMVMIHKATELCNEVKYLGTAMLAALEKYDAEGLALLRSSNEISLLQAIRLVKKQQVDEAQDTHDGLVTYQSLVQKKIDYYSTLISNGWNSWEIASFALSTASTLLDIPIGLGHILSGGMKLIPNFSVGISGFGGSPNVTVSMGGSEIGASLDSGISALSTVAHALDKVSALTSTVASYHRRADDWQHQLDISKIEKAQIQKQIDAAQVRIDIANQEVANQDLQITNAQSTDAYMHTKFTNQDLYNWMITQLSVVYFEGYQLAFDIAKRAEQCFRYELGLAASSYINFGYWDSLHKGLLSGDQLMSDIKRMEMAYYEQNKREYELTKHISLSLLDPVALLKLKENGECWINLPETIFDLDYPGHYMRRIKTVSITVPCVTGPFTNINCTLTLTKNSTRVSNLSSGPANYPRKLNASNIPVDDTRFRDNVAMIQSIATSSAQNDSGLFEVNFRDERYLPFEGAGAISTWHIQLPAVFKQFNYETISDLVIHLRYTARDGGEGLAGDAQSSLKDAINAMLTSPNNKGMYKAFSGKHDFPTEWYKFLNPAAAADHQQLNIDITRRFPLFTNEFTVKISRVDVLVDFADNTSPSLDLNHGLTLTTPATVSPPAVAESDPVVLSQDHLFGELYHAEKAFAGLNMKDPGIWSIINTKADVDPASINDLIIIFYYGLTA